MAQKDGEKFTKSRGFVCNQKKSILLPLTSHNNEKKLENTFGLLVNSFKLWSAKLFYTEGKSYFPAEFYFFHFRYFFFKTGKMGIQVKCMFKRLYGGIGLSGGLIN